MGAVQVAAAASPMADLGLVLVPVLSLVMVLLCCNAAVLDVIDYVAPW